MKFLLIASFFAAFSAMAQNNGEVFVKNFGAKVPGEQHAMIKGTTGNCALEGYPFGTHADMIILHEMDRNRSVGGQWLNIVVDHDKTMNFTFGSCAGGMPYTSAVTVLADGSRALEVTCKSKPFSGWGSAWTKITVDSKDVIRRIQLISKYGAWENFKRVNFDCSFK